MPCSSIYWFVCFLLSLSLCCVCICFLIYSVHSVCSFFFSYWLIANVIVQLQAGADPNVASHPSGATPLFLAAQLGAQDLVDLLTRANANPNQAESTGLTPMHVAANGNVVRLLFAVRADVNALTHAGSSPMAVAEESGRKDVVRELQQLGGKLVQQSANRRQSQVLTRTGSEAVVVDPRSMSARAAPSAGTPFASSSSSSSSQIADTNGVMLSSYPFFVGMTPREQLLQGL